MKQGRRPTKKQKVTLAAFKLNPNNWLVTKNLPGELHLQHKLTGRPRVLKRRSQVG